MSYQTPTRHALLGSGRPPKTKLLLNAVRCPYTFVHNDGRDQLSGEWRHNENDVIMRTGASAVGVRRHHENDVTMTIAGLWRYGDWRHVATGCTAVWVIYMGHQIYCFHNLKGGRGLVNVRPIGGHQGTVPVNGC